ncbi:TRAP transporter permease [Acuticoccus sp.]|uniref:TRAP transporter permease n=1 Tax=Acuticoccus sp. TaxID=1904378 RepID=UPI003B5205A5
MTKTATPTDVDTSFQAAHPEVIDPAKSVSPAARVVIMIGTAAGLCLVVYQLFNLAWFGVLIEQRYLYALAGLFLAIAFLVFRINGRKGGAPSVLDWLLAGGAFVTAGYLVWTADTNLAEAWEYAAPPTAQWIAIAFFVHVLEATRRAGGWVLFFIVTLFAFYPTFASHVPDPFSGFQSPPIEALPYHIFSSEAAFGIPMNAFGSLVIGFIVFGAVLQRTGGGQFFNDLAMALVGHYRGGAAKVSIFASGFMGSMSGSVISNVLTTGAVSIPAMKRTGFSAHKAAATEACASTGGVLMPPIMGATAFVMASFLSRPYIEIAIAAAIPSLLFYFGLFVQIDAYAGRKRLAGIPLPDLPRILATLKSGWLYIGVFALLIALMVGWRLETTAPFYATLLLLVVNQVLHSHRLTLKGLGELIVGVGAALAELVAVLLGVGLIVGAFSATGLAGTLVNELIFIAGDNTFVLLLMGAATAFVFGMGMTVTACYIFLAVVLAPALEAGGLNQLAVHLFILYWGMVSFITPPVALGAFAAATLAGSNAMRTGLEAMRLGSVIYIVPFFFVLNPALIGEGSAVEVTVTLATALLGVGFISMALQGYVSFAGPLTGWDGLLMRALLLAGGLFFAVPTIEGLGLNHLELSAIGLALCAVPVLRAMRAGRTAAPSPA